MQSIWFPVKRKLIQGKNVWFNICDNLILLFVHDTALSPCFLSFKSNQFKQYFQKFGMIQLELINVVFIKVKMEYRGGGLREVFDLTPFLIVVPVVLG